MDQIQPPEVPDIHPSDAAAPPSKIESGLPSGTVTPQAAAGSCPTCAAPQAANLMPPSSSFVYVIGRLEPRFPTLAVDKEFRQATARAGSTTVELTDRAAMQKVLQEPHNGYLVRQLCWVLLVQGIETYIAVPRFPADYQVLVNAYRAEATPGDIDVVIGVRGPIAPPTMCNGLLVPIVGFDQIYWFTRDELLHACPKPPDADAEAFRRAAGETLERIMLRSDNAGGSDADRALNYLAVRCPQIYATAARAFTDNASFTSIDVRTSPLSGTRNILDVVFAFTNRATDVVSKHFVRVDVTEEFPFLVTPMSPYYDRY